MKKNRILALIVLLCFFLAGCSGFINKISTEIAEHIKERNEPQQAEIVQPEIQESSEINKEPGEIKETEEEEVANEPPELVDIQVHFVDVGQGDAILIQTPSKTVLIDGGEKGSGIIDYLKKVNVNTLDLVIATHPHADHIGGLLDVLNTFKVKEVIDPGVVHTTEIFEEYLKTIDRLNVKFTEGRAGLVRDLGNNIKLEILYPVSIEAKSINNTSIVAKLTHYLASFLFTGDIEEEAEKELLRNENLKSTVLKVPHHGSSTSLTLEFLNKVNPKIAVIMVGQGNDYGHPHKEVLKRLKGIDVYRTDQDGTVVITTNGEELTVKKEKQSVASDKPGTSSSEGKININTASVEELMTLPGIGQVLAEEIVKYRKHGKFNSIEEIMSVRGISEARFEKIKDLIMVE